MPANLPGPYQIDIAYVTTLGSVPLTHHMVYDCMAVGSPPTGTPFNTIQLACKDTSTRLADLAVGDLWGFIRPMFASTTTVSNVILYRIPTGTKSRVFVSAMASALPVGSSAGATNDSHQLTLSFLSGNGGTKKVTLIEDTLNLKDQQALVPNAAGTAQQRLAAYLLSAASWVLSKDDAFLSAATFLTGGENEAIAKKRHPRQ